MYFATVMPDNNSKYMVGIDTATAHGNDYSAIEVFDYDTYEQVAEGLFKCKLETFANEYIPMIIDLLPRKALCIERNNVGVSIIESLEHKYRKSIVKNQITKKDDESLGIVSSGTIRNILIECIFNDINENRDYIYSPHYRMQASSLERKSSGKIEGYPNDDMLFARGFGLLVKNRIIDMSPYFSKSENDIKHEELADAAISISVGSIDKHFIDIMDNNNLDFQEYIDIKRTQIRNPNKRNILDEFLDIV